MSGEFDTNLRKLAKLAVRFGVNIQPGQVLYLTAPTSAMPLARYVADEAYRAGAAHVLPFYLDDHVSLSKYKYGSDEALDYAPDWMIEALTEQARSGKLARLGIYGDTPSLLAEQPSEKVARAGKAAATANRPLMEAVTTATNWSIVAAATPTWAAEVFPELPVGDAEKKLWDLIFRATRIYEDDPVAAWRRDFEELQRRRNALQVHCFDALHFEGGGTDLTVGLAKGHRWVGGDEKRPNGLEYAPNLPTEEVFTMPDRNRVNGKAVFSKTSVIQGTKVDKLVVEFNEGKATSITAETGQEVARNFFTTDEGASYLGEVALVSNTSPVAQCDTLFLNTLFDENAACHIAFGMAYSINLSEGCDPEEAGMNKSKIHHDCMIGHGEMNVTGIKADGSRLPVMEAGEFVI